MASQIEIVYDDDDGGWWMVTVDDLSIDGFRTEEDAWSFVQSKEILL